jgi:hypothetical protein
LNIGIINQSFCTCSLVFSTPFIVETPIPKAKRSGIGKLNNPAQLAAEPVSKACFGVHTRDYNLLFYIKFFIQDSLHTPQAGT